MEKVDLESLNNNDVKLLEQVKEYIKENEAISISRIQSEFGVGYPRASQIMRQLIEEGLVKINADGRYTIIR